MFSLLAFALLLAASVHASVYVTQPIQASSCTGGQSCTVTWVDNGQAPLNTQIGQCQIDLYTGNFMMVQSLGSVNVGSTSSFSFTPNPDVGPNGQYYLVFTASSINYQGFSGSFALNGLTGTTPGGGSSTPASTPTATPTGSSTSAGSTTPATGSSTPATTPTDTNTPTGTSTPTDTSTTPTLSTSSSDTATTPSPTLTTPSVTTTPTGTTTSPTTTTAARTSASATPSNAAGRVGSSTSLSGLAALLVLSGVLAL